MKKVVTVLVLLLTVSLGLFALTGCVSGDEVYELPDKLIIAYDNHFPPMGFRDEAAGKDVGFDLDLADAVCTYLGIEYELRAIEWKTKETLLNNGSVDLIWNGYTMSENRMKQVDFSVPYLRNAQVLVVQNNAPFQTIADLKGKQLYMQSESTAVESYLANENIKDNPVDKLSENETCFTQLGNNADSAIVTDRVLAEYMMSRPANVGKFRIISEQLEPEKYAVGMRKTDVLLRHKINEALVELRANGKLLEIAQKWGLEDALLI